MIGGVDIRLPARFRSKVRVSESSGCWEWTADTKYGYGRFTLSGDRKEQAHRYSYRILVGPIPAGLEIDHLCRNRSCVNPSHLEAVPRDENNRRSSSPTAINATKTHCPKGHPYSGQNLIVENGGRHRKCRICRYSYLREREGRRQSVALGLSRGR